MSKPEEPKQGEPRPFVFPTLPIVTAAPERLTIREKYGALYYLGVFGLGVLVALVGWFGYQVWALRSIWRDVYVLHDAGRGDDERIVAAFELSRDERVNARQKWDIAMRKSLPTMARYVLAEGLTTEAAMGDPEEYALSVAKSEGWPPWLRTLATLPMAEAAALDLPVGRKSLGLLSQGEDQSTALIATYALAVGPEGEPKARAAILKEAETSTSGLAAILGRALTPTRPLERLQVLEEVAPWLREHDPEAVEVWKGWVIAGNRLVRRK